MGIPVGYNLYPEKVRVEVYCANCRRTHWKNLPRTERLRCGTGRDSDREREVDPLDSMMGRGGHHSNSRRSSGYGFAPSYLKEDGDLDVLDFNEIPRYGRHRSSLSLRRGSAENNESSDVPRIRTIDSRRSSAAAEAVPASVTEFV